MSGKSRPDAVSSDDPYGDIRGAGTGGSLQFAGVADVFATAADAVTRRGDAMVVSRTTDGGALSVRVLHDALVTKWYAKDVDELQGVLDALSKVT